MTYLTNDNYKIYGDFPLTIEANKNKDLKPLLAWLHQEKKRVAKALLKHGAIRFRHFDINTPEAFEKVARAIAPNLKNDYLGTSPRDAVTDYVFHASELPGYFPIPQHCEMSFCANPPEFLFFSAMNPSEENSGETPICDMREVWRQMDEHVRERFSAKGMKNVRNYSAPGAPAGDQMQLKSWDEMFQSTDKAVVEKKCEEEGFEPEWKADGGLRLWGTQKVSKQHPLSGIEAWYNHLAVFHVSSPVGEYQRICNFRPTPNNESILEMARSLEKNMRGKPPKDLSMHTFYGDGSEIPEEDIEHVRDLIWRNLHVRAWEKGDVLAIDNASVSHGRLPYNNEDREILVCWS